MKFAENNRISHRQLYRQMILTFLAPFLICLPGKNGIQGMTGIAGVLAAVILLVIYVFVLLRVTSGYSDMVRFFDLPTVCIDNTGNRMECWMKR